MVLSHETVNAYKELLTNPQKHGLQFKHCMNVLKK